MKSRGVIYYNRGTGCLARLIVSLQSLREHYDGNVSIICADIESEVYIKKIANKFGAIAILWNSPVSKGKGQVFLETTLAADYTPYSTTIWLDADTIVVGDVTDLFQQAEENEIAMTQFSNWTMAQGIIRRRIKSWADIYPKRVKRYVGKPEYQSLNCGVYGFITESKFMQDWYKFAEPGRSRFIPNEVAMQLSIWEYPHLVADQKYNCSCKYSDINDPDVRVIHYHGKKHCRMDENKNVLFNGNLWVDRYEKILEENLCDIHSYLPLILKHDRTLRRYTKR